jgi:hypothetical protein
MVKTKKKEKEKQAHVQMHKALPALQTAKTFYNAMVAAGKHAASLKGGAKRRAFHAGVAVGATVDTDGCIFGCKQTRHYVNEDVHTFDCRLSFAQKWKAYLRAKKKFIWKTFGIKGPEKITVHREGKRNEVHTLVYSAASDVRLLCTKGCFFNKKAQAELVVGSKTFGYVQWAQLRRLNQGKPYLKFPKCVLKRGGCRGCKQGQKDLAEMDKKAKAADRKAKAAERKAKKQTTEGHVLGGGSDSDCTDS